MSTQYQKFLTSVALMNDCVAVAKDRIQVSATWDRLYQFIFDNFAEPATSSAPLGYIIIGADALPEGQEVELHSLAEILTMTDMTGLMSRIKDIPPSILETVFPVAIARYLLCAVQCNVTDKSLKTFDQFHQWYGAMVFSAATIVTAAKDAARKSTL